MTGVLCFDWRGLPQVH